MKFSAVVSECGAHFHISLAEIRTMDDDFRRRKAKQGQLTSSQPIPHRQIDCVHVPASATWPTLQESVCKKTKKKKT
jgi:hypothetical protein